MPRHLLSALLVVSLLSLLSHTAFADTPLVADGKSAYVIVLSADASPSEKRGAAEIQTHLQQMAGVKLPIQTDDQPLPERAILVGRSKHTDALGIVIDPAALGPEGFILRTAGNRIVLAGSRVRGTMYACTTFLEKLGVRWFTPKVTFIPRQPNVLVPALDESQTPAFEYREPYFTEALDKDWAARLKTNGSNAHLDASTGGRVFYHHFVHTFDALVPPKLFETHPEYFPMIKGKRTAGYVQRCLTNPQVLQLSIDAVLKWIDEKPSALLYSVSQNDTGKWCECDKCKALTAQYGGHSGLYLWFVNQVAEAVEKQHPDKLIDTLAYQFTESPPTGIVPRPNVRVRLCPISCCVAHPFETCADPHSVAFMKNLRAWGKLTNTLYIWHYNTNFAHYLLPFPDFDEFPAEIRLYKSSGVKGIFFEGAYGHGGGAAEAELRSYLMAKLLWNPKADNDALVTEWMQGVYRAAAPPMRQWFDLLHQKVRDPKAHFFIYSPPTIGYLSADVLEQGQKLFDQARQLAQADPQAAEYVCKASLGLRYAQLMQKPQQGELLTTFLADLKKFNIAEVAEGRTVETWLRSYNAKAKK